MLLCRNENIYIIMGEKGGNMGVLLYFCCEIAQEAFREGTRRVKIIITGHGHKGFSRRNEDENDGEVAGLQRKFATDVSHVYGW